MPEFIPQFTPSWLDEFTAGYFQACEWLGIEDPDEVRRGGDDPGDIKPLSKARAFLCAGMQPIAQTSSTPTRPTWKPIARKPVVTWTAPGWIFTFRGAVTAPGISTAAIIRCSTVCKRRHKACPTRAASMFAGADVSAIGAIDLCNLSLERIQP